VGSTAGLKIVAKRENSLLAPVYYSLDERENTVAYSELDGNYILYCTYFSRL
jgi:hypothetical protein